MKKQILKSLATSVGWFIGLALVSNFVFHEANWVATACAAMVPAGVSYYLGFTEGRKEK